MELRRRISKGIDRVGRPTANLNLKNEQKRTITNKQVKVHPFIPKPRLGSPKLYFLRLGLGKDYLAQKVSPGMTPKVIPKHILFGKADERKHKENKWFRDHFRQSGRTFWVPFVGLPFSQIN